MQSVLEATTVDDAELVGRMFERITVDLGIILDRELGSEEVSAGRETKRVAGEGAIHISFKLGIQAGEDARHGALLVPLPDALAMAGHLMMLEEAEVRTLRAAQALERPEKEALLEVGSFVAGAIDAIVRSYFEGHSVHGEGCQGVRADVRPAFPHTDGEELIVGRARVRSGDDEPFDAILMLPVLGG